MRTDRPLNLQQNLRDAEQAYQQRLPILEEQVARYDLPAMKESYELLEAHTVETIGRRQRLSEDVLVSVIAILFAFGAAMFALGCVLSLTPSLTHQAGLSPLQVNAVFFAGSIPFTTAAYLQLFQAANAPEGHAPGARSPSTCTTTCASCCGRAPRPSR